MACCTRRRHSSIASPASRTAWNGSMTATASGTSSVVAVLKPVKPSIATSCTLSRPPTMLVHADDPHAVEPGRVVDQHPAPPRPERRVRPLAGHAVPWHPCPAAPATPLLVVGAHDAAGQRSTSRFQALADCLAELPPRLVKPKWIMSV